MALRTYCLLALTVLAFRLAWDALSCHGEMPLIARTAELGVVELASQAAAATGNSVSFRKGESVISVRTDVRVYEGIAVPVALAFRMTARSAMLAHLPIPPSFTVAVALSPYYVKISVGMRLAQFAVMSSRAVSSQALTVAGTLPKVAVAPCPAFIALSRGTD
jgi:hypothetical protein